MRTPTPGNCPVCSKKFTHTSCLTDATATAQPGDITLCIRCGAVLKMNSAMVAERMTAQEIIALPSETLQQIHKAQAGIFHLRARLN